MLKDGGFCEELFFMRTVDPLSHDDHPDWESRWVGTKVPEWQCSARLLRSADQEFADHSSILMTWDTAEQYVTSGFQFDATGVVFVGEGLKGEVIYSLDTKVVVDGAFVA